MTAPGSLARTLGRSLSVTVTAAGALARTLGRMLGTTVPATAMANVEHPSLLALPATVTTAAGLSVTLIPNVILPPGVLSIAPATTAILTITPAGPLAARVSITGPFPVAQALTLMPPATVRVTAYPPPTGTPAQGFTSVPGLAVPGEMTPGDPG